MGHTDPTEHTFLNTEVLGVSGQARHACLACVVMAEGSMADIRFRFGKRGFEYA